jgi:hypothetical protein
MTLFGWCSTHPFPAPPPPFFFTLPDVGGDARHLAADAALSFTLSPDPTSPGPADGQVLVSLQVPWLQSITVDRVAGAVAHLPHGLIPYESLMRALHSVGCPMPCWCGCGDSLCRL